MDRWSDNIIVAKLAPDGEAAEELQVMAKVISHRPDCDLILDLANLSNVRVSTVHGLTQLRRLAHRLGRQFALANISPGVRHLPGLYGHKGFFEAVSDAQVALSGVDPGRDVGTILIACKGTGTGAQRRRYRRTRICDLIRVPCIIHRLEVEADADGDTEQGFQRGRLIDLSQAGALVALAGIRSSSMEQGEVVELSFSSLLARDRIRVKGRVVQTGLTADGASVCVSIEFPELEAMSYESQAIESLCGFTRRCLEASSGDNQTTGSISGGWTRTTDPGLMNPML